MANIRWRKKDIKQLQKKVKNFNAKITRLEKKDVSFAIPERMSYKELKKTITARSDYNTAIKRLTKFTGRGNELPLQIPNVSQWLVDEYDIALNKRKKQIEKEVQMLADLNASVMGVDMGYKRAEKDVQDNRINEYKMKSAEKVKAEDFAQIAADMGRAIYGDYYNNRWEQFKENHVAALLKAFGDTGLGRKIIEKVLKSSINDFIKKVYQEELAIIDFYYEYARMRSGLIATAKAWGVIKEDEEPDEKLLVTDTEKSIQLFKDFDAVYNKLTIAPKTYSRGRYNDLFR